MADEQKKKKVKGKNKHKHGGVPLSKAGLVGGSALKRPVGRPQSRVLQDGRLAKQTITHIEAKMSTWHGELFEDVMAKWIRDFLNPLATAVDSPMRIILSTTQIVVIQAVMDEDTFAEKLTPIMDRLNKRLKIRIITGGMLAVPPPKWGKYTVGGPREYCIVACLPGAITLPEELPQNYVEYFLKAGQFANVDLSNVLNDEGLELLRNMFQNFAEAEQAEQVEE